MVSASRQGKSKQKRIRRQGLLLDRGKEREKGEEKKGVAPNRERLIVGPYYYHMSRPPSSSFFFIYIFLKKDYIYISLNKRFVHF